VRLTGHPGRADAGRRRARIAPVARTGHDHPIRDGWGAFTGAAGAAESVVCRPQPVKGLMLQAMLLPGIVVAPPGSAAPFLPATACPPRQCLVGHTTVRHGHHRHDRARRGGGGHPAPARRDPAQPGGGRGGRSIRQRDLYAADQALVRPRAYVLGLQREPPGRCPPTARISARARCTPPTGLGLARHDPARQKRPD
jgi:hypothetical protein